MSPHWFGSGMHTCKSRTYVCQELLADKDVEADSRQHVCLKLQACYVASNPKPCKADLVQLPPPNPPANPPPLRSSWAFWAEVYVALPVAVRCHWTVRAIMAGKHVLCETPSEPWLPPGLATL